VGAAGVVWLFLAEPRGEIPADIRSSAGTFDSSTTWMGTDKAGCKRQDYLQQLATSFQSWSTNANSTGTRG